MKGIEFLIACAILFPVLVMQGSEGRPGKHGLLSGFGDSSLMAPEPRERTDMMCDFEDFSSFSPEIKPALFECLIRKGFHIDISEVHRLENLSNECLGLIHGTFPVPRRHLENQSQSPPPALSSAAASSPAPARSFDTGDEKQTPSSAPSLSSDTALASSPSPGQHSSVMPGDVSPSVPRNRLPNPTPVLNKQDRTKSVIIAVVLSSVGTSLLIACVFCCYRNFFKESRYSGKEENPLLHLSLSEFQESPNKSFGSVGLNHHTGKLGGLPPSNGSYQNGQGFSADDRLNGTSSSDLMSGYPHSSNGVSLGLPPPPGRLISSAVPTTPTPVVSAPADTAPSSPAAVPPLVASPPLPPLVASPLPSPVAAPPPPPPNAPPPPFKRPISKAPPPQPPLPKQKHDARPPPPPPPKASLPHQLQGSSKGKGPEDLGSAGDDGNASKTKLKPFFWDKVLANPNQSNVWQQIRSGSFQLDEEMIESLFGYNGAIKSNEGKKESSAGEPTIQFIQILDPKKSQNLAISLKASSVKKQDVCEALMEGNELPTALLQTLLRMQPTPDEELKLRLYTGDFSLLGPAEQFLKDLIDIPFPYKRIDVLLFMSSLHEDVSAIKESFATLEVACTELKGNRLFLKLLEAVLKTGNRMNDGTFRGGAQAFKLDTLLKLSDVKGADGKTTLLHFVVQEIVRSEGKRAARSERSARESGSKSSLGNLSWNSDDFYEDSALGSEDNCLNLGLNIVSSLSGEFENVKKAAILDVDAISSTVTSFGRRLTEIKEFLNTDMKNLGEDSGFHHSLKCFVGHADTAITFLLEEELRIRSLLQSTTIYFHGSAGKDEGLQLFVIVRDFLGILDKVCKEVRESAKKVTKPLKVRDSSSVTSTPITRQLLFPSIVDRSMDSSSSDEDDP